MPAVQRVGDSDSGGGRIIQGVDSVQVNGLAIAVNQDPVTGHGPPPHSGPTTVAHQNTTVFANGILVIVTGDADSCGHNRVCGSPNVTIG